jgi:hypothetical protein
LQVGGGGKSVVMAGGSSCGGYDDFGSYDCVGGEGGGGGSEGRMRDLGYETPEESAQCGYNAVENFKSCKRTAEDLYNNGAGR